MFIYNAIPHSLIDVLSRHVLFGNYVAAMQLIGKCGVMLFAEKHSITCEEEVKTAKVIVSKIARANETRAENAPDSVIRELRVKKISFAAIAVLKRQVNVKFRFSDPCLRFFYQAGRYLDFFVLLK